MCVCVCVCVCVFVCVCVCVYIYVTKCIYMYIYIYTCVCMKKEYICMFDNQYRITYTYSHVGIHVSMNATTHTPSSSLDVLC